MRTTLAILGVLAMTTATGTSAAEGGAVFVGFDTGPCVSVFDPDGQLPVNHDSTDCSGSGGRLRFVAGYRTASGQKCYFVDTDTKMAGECNYPVHVGIHVDGLP